MRRWHVAATRTRSKHGDDPIFALVQTSSESEPGRKSKVRSIMKLQKLATYLIEFFVCMNGIEHVRVEAVAEKPAIFPNHLKEAYFFKHNGSWVAMPVASVPHGLIPAVEPMQEWRDNTPVGRRLKIEIGDKIEEFIKSNYPRSMAIPDTTKSGEPIVQTEAESQVPITSEDIQRINKRDDDNAFGGAAGAKKKFTMKASTQLQKWF